MPLRNFCEKCRQHVSNPCFIASTDKTKECVVVATDPELLRWCTFQRNALGVKALGLARRELPNRIAAELSRPNVHFLTATGAPFEITDTAVDDAFRNDGSFRWLSDFIGYADRPPVQTPQERVLARLRLIDLAFRVALATGQSSMFPPNQRKGGGNL